MRCTIVQPTKRGVNMGSIIKIFAEDDAGVVVKGALPGGLREIGARVHDVSEEVVQKNLARVMQQVEAMVASGAATINTLTVKEVKVAVAVTGSGEVSLLGLSKASAELKATLEITFVPKA